MASDQGRKRWYRPRNILLGIAVAIVAMVVYAVTWAHTVQPQPSVDYRAELEALVAVAQPPGENGWAKLIDAVGALDNIEAQFDFRERPEEHRERIDYRWLLHDGASPEAMAMARQALVHLRGAGAFELLREAGESPMFVRAMELGDDTVHLLMLMELPNLSRLRALAQACAGEMREQLAQGDYEAAASTFDHAMTIGVACARQATLIDYLVGQAIANLAITELRYALLEHVMGASALEAIEDVLRKRTMPSIALAMEGERRMMLDVIQHMYTDDGRGGGTLLPSRLAEAGLANIYGTPLEGMETVPRIANLLGPLFANRRDVTAMLDEYYDHAARLAPMSRTQRRMDAFSEREFVGGLSWQFGILKGVLPAMGRALDAQDQRQMYMRGTLLMLAIERHRHMHGEYPATLDAIDAAILPVPLADPLHGGPFGYRLLDDDPHGRAYLLYSFGNDGVDDGGRELRGRRRGSVLGESGPSGYDYVINAPRPVDDRDDED